MEMVAGGKGAPGKRPIEAGVHAAKKPRGGPGSSGPGSSGPGSSTPGSSSSAPRRRGTHRTTTTTTSGSSNSHGAASSSNGGSDLATLQAEVDQLMEREAEAAASLKHLRTQLDEAIANLVAANEAAAAEAEAAAAAAAAAEAEAAAAAAAAVAAREVRCYPATLLSCSLLTLCILLAGMASHWGGTCAQGCNLHPSGASRRTSCHPLGAMGHEEKAPG